MEILSDNKSFLYRLINFVYAVEHCGGSMVYCKTLKIRNWSVPYLVSSNWWANENCQGQCSRPIVWCCIPDVLRQA